MTTVLAFFSNISKKDTPDKRLNPLITDSAWYSYTGGEVPPFSVYLRLSNSFIILANMHAYNKSGSNKGRLPFIISALESITNKVIFEGVINANVRKHLLQKGYVKDHRKGYESNLVKESK